jgi:hypothetical protein
MRASGGLVGFDPEHELARLLPKDHRARMATTELRQVLEQLGLDLTRFGGAWFADPPNLPEGREAIADLHASAEALRRSLRELDALCRAVEP